MLYTKAYANRATAGLLRHIATAPGIT